MQLKPATGQQPGDDRHGDGPRGHDPFTAWLVSLQPAIHRLAARLAGNASDAADLAQATNLRALEKQELFIRGSMDDLKRWLSKIMVHLHFDALRRTTREVAAGWLDEVAATVEPPPPAWSLISDEEMSAAVEQLRPPLREAYRLFAVDRVSYAIISSRLQIPLSTVATRILRARARLRESLTDGVSRRAA